MRPLREMSMAGVWGGVMVSPAPKGLRAVAQLAKPCVAAVEPCFKMQWTSEVVTGRLWFIEGRILALEAGRLRNVGSGGNPDNCVDAVNPAARGVLRLLQLAPRLDGHHCPGSYFAFLASNESKLAGSLYR